ncbi:MAG: Wzz/FepE/Etk N-terminal domain-containing protein [bacterium]|nr:Wzz/FepE/Etk N-terminal domain-containing protein [bacterium]
MEEQEIDLSDYIRVILKRKWFIFIGTAICTLAALLLNALQPPVDVYEARASLLLIPPAFKTELTQAPFSMEVYKALAKAQDLEQAIIDTLRLEDAAGSPLNISALDGLLKPEILSQSTTYSSMVNLVVTSADTAALPPVRLANTWAELFVKKNSGINSREAIGSYEFIRDQYETARTNLHAAEDTLRALDEQHDLGFMKNELGPKQARLAQYHTAHVNSLLDLKSQTLALQNLQQKLQAIQTPEGLWVGGFSVKGYGNIRVESLNKDQHEMLTNTVRTRDHVLSLQERVRTYNDENNLDFFNKDLQMKQSKFTNLMNESSDIEIETASMDQILKDLGPVNPSNGLLAPVVNTDSEVIVARLASLLNRYNFFKPRQKQLNLRVHSLKTEIDTLENLSREHQLHLTWMSDRLDVIQKAYQSLSQEYASVNQRAQDLELSTEALRTQIAASGKAVERLYSEVQKLTKTISDLELERARLVRDNQTLKSTYDRFAALLEDARINKAGKTGDIKIVIRAVEAIRLPGDAPSNTTLLGVAVGLLLSVFLAFFLEYVEKTKTTLEA